MIAWTSPRTWVANEIVSAALMNTHVRDNLLQTAAAKVTTAGDVVVATGANAFARVGRGAMSSGIGNDYVIPKTSDESVTASTTMQDDDELLLPMLANEIWIVEPFLIISGPAAADFKFQFTMPVSCTQRMVVQYVNTSAATTSAHTGGTTSLSVGFDVANTPAPWAVYAAWFYVVNGANAGNFQLQWAQVVSDATATIVSKGSHLKCIKVT